MFNDRCVEFYYVQNKVCATVICSRSLGYSSKSLGQDYENFMCYDDDDN